MLRQGGVLGNSAGVEQGLPCVLYPKGSTWADANAIMYAKIAGTDYEDVGKFVAMAIKQMEASYRKNVPALNEVLKSFAYMKVEGGSKEH